MNHIFASQVYCNEKSQALLENNFLQGNLIQSRVHDRNQFQRFQLNVNSPQKSKSMQWPK